MTEHLRANEHGLNYQEASTFLTYCADEIEWEGDDILAEDLRIKGAYYERMQSIFPKSTSVRIFSPDFNNDFWQAWRKRNGITTWEEVARKRKEWQQASAARRV
jgi:hypothetical protein